MWVNCDGGDCLTASGPLSYCLGCRTKILKSGDWDFGRVCFAVVHTPSLWRETVVGAVTEKTENGDAEACCAAEVVAEPSPYPPPVALLRELS
jgi:hypothetical protein